MQRVMNQTFLAALATLFVISSYIPQIIKGYRSKSLRDISMIFLVIIMAGTVTWMLYAVSGQDYRLLISNSIVLLFVIILASMKVYYDNRKIVGS
jgi:MtN3 and saliva related transmembrane protein